ncbi:hypothetical protein [Arthrobacter sp. zg-Y1110]|uniref:hypothetical protein n=1 Tax=Arthrobacter sp. zg-Y1110 TaxID=2886932 RepID=UPI001D15464E|nr:hypothetical protein [Arthrobacter sp. zg-Y1110]MCC3292465.1 hypothetical protein [Arthrobacter sp. zg-Y1110]UWX87102.1 hypothetical protein N2K99_17275 [Arthrobacter sp. zg-Y1110]
MGDHLHKAIGWAVPSPEDPLDRGAMLTRIAAGDHPEWLFRKTDPMDGESVLVLPSLEDHARWLRDKASAVGDEETSDEITYDADLLVQDRNRALDECVLHVPQLDGGTMLLIPPTYLKDWHRMDDDLDCAFAEDGPIENRITYTRSNPFPLSHLWMDALTGRALAGPAGDAVTLRGTERGNQAAARVRFQGDSTPAFTHPDEAASRIAPAIPRAVVHLVQHLGNFLDPQQLLQLRPARAVWVG